MSYTKINDRIKRVCDLWIDSNYQRTFKSCWLEIYPNTSPTALEVRPYQVKKLPDVQAYIEQRRKEISEESYINGQMIQDELSRIAFSDDENINAKLKALELLQKQLGLQNQNINANVNAQVVFEGEDKLED